MIIGVAFHGDDGPLLGLLVLVFYHGPQVIVAIAKYTGGYINGLANDPLYGKTAIVNLWLNVVNNAAVLHGLWDSCY